MKCCDFGGIVPIAIIYLALFFDFFLLEGYVILQPELASLNNLAENDLVVTGAICKFAMMLTCPLVALSSTRLAAHHILTIGIGFLAVSALGLAFSKSFIMFAISKVAHGIASPMLTLSSMSILTYMAEETSRGQYASYGYTAISHGLLVAPFLTGLMVEELGQRSAYLILFAIIASNFIWAFLHFNELLCWRRKKVVVADSEDSAPKKDIKLFEPINSTQFKKLLLTLLLNPRMITAVGSCFLVGVSIGSGESVFPLVLKGAKTTMGLSNKQVQLIWTSSSIAYFIFSPFTGFLADRIPPIRLVYGGITGLIITYALMPQVCSSLVGVISHLTVTGALTSFLDVAAYPLIASVVDTANIPNAYVIGYAIEYCLEQGGYAIGLYSGEPLMKAYGSLKPVAYLVTGMDTLLLCFTLVVMYVFPAERFVVKSAKTEDPEKGEAVIAEQD
jgi:MFS family permease